VRCAVQLIIFLGGFFLGACGYTLKSSWFICGAGWLAGISASHGTGRQCKWKKGQGGTKGVDVLDPRQKKVNPSIDGRIFAVLLLLSLGDHHGALKLVYGYLVYGYGYSTVNFQR
jgi:hypothetical protein